MTNSSNRSQEVITGLCIGLACLVIGGLVIWFVKKTPPPEDQIRQTITNNSKNTQPLPDDFRGHLAALLNLPKDQADWLFLNLPPRPNCYPGTVMALERNLPFLAAVSEKEPNLARGSAFEEELHSKVVSSLEGSGLVATMVRGDLGDKAEAEVEVIITKAQVIDIKNTQDFKDRVLKLPKVKELEAKNVYPLAIFRAYEGLITFNVRVKNARKGDLEAKLPKFELKGGVENDGSGNFTIKSAEPTVFAYLAVTTAFVQKNMAEQGREFVAVRALGLTPWEIAETKSQPKGAAGALNKLNEL